MQIVKRSAHYRGLKKRDGDDTCRLYIRQFIMPAKKINGGGGGRENGGLPYLKRHGRRKNKIKRQKQIVYRRHMHRKMRQELVSLACGDWRKALAHIVEHLTEYSEIVVRRKKINISEYAYGSADKNKHRNGCDYINIAFFCGKRFFQMQPRGFVIVKQHYNCHCGKAHAHKEIALTLHCNAERIESKRHGQQLAVVRFLF